MRKQDKSSAFTPLALSKDKSSHFQCLSDQKSQKKIHAIRDKPKRKYVKKKRGKNTPSQQILPTCKNQENIEIKKLTDIPTLTKFGTLADHDFEDGVVMRQAHDEKVTLQRKQMKQKHLLYIIAQFKAIQQDYQEMFAQSVEYLSQLAERSELSIAAKKALSRASISNYLSRLFGGVFQCSFHKHSKAMLDDRLAEIIKDFKTISQGSSLRIQIEILAYFLKNFFQFHEYFPQNETTFPFMQGTLKVFTTVLNIDLNQYKQLKQIFAENSRRIKYFEQISEIRSLVNVYYLIVLKQRIIESARLQIQVASLEAVICELKVYKAKAMQAYRYPNANIDKISLSELYVKRNNKASRKRMPIDQLLKTLQSYEQIIDQYGLQIAYPEIKAIKYATRKQFRVDLFVRYVQKKKSLLLRFNNDLSSFKNALITRQIIQKPECCYEEAAKKIFSHTSVYIEQQYFKNNLFSLLLKEVQYQQFKYLGRVFRGVTERIRHGKSVLFLDSFSLREERGQEGEQQERMAPEASITVAVTLKGALLCKTPSRPISGIELIKEYRPILQGSLPSIILLFDDQFPFSLELDKREEVYLLRKTHTLLLLPRTSLVPNPCRVIADYLKDGLKQRLNEEGFEKAIQGAIHELDEKQVKNIADKEWEKVQKFVATCNPVLRNEQTKEQPNSTNVKESQKMIGEFEEFEGIERAIECEMPEPKELNPFQNISLQNLEKVNEYEKEEKQIEWASQQFLEEQQGQKIRVSNQVPSLPQPIMENLHFKSVDDLRTALSHLLTRNKKDPFAFSIDILYNQNGKEIQALLQNNSGFRNMIPSSSNSRVQNANYISIEH